MVFKGEGDAQRGQPFLRGLKIGLTDITAQIHFIHTPVQNWQGSGFESRSCYQIGDSKRIQADYDMALALSAPGIVPVMLIMCNTSLKSPVRRLAQSWNVYSGMDAFNFISMLTGYDLYGFMVRNKATFSEIVNQILAKLL